MFFFVGALPNADQPILIGDIGAGIRVAHGLQLLIETLLIDALTMIGCSPGVQPVMTSDLVIHCASSI